MKKTWKLFLGFCTPVGVVAPVISAVACNDKTTLNKTAQLYDDSKGVISWNIANITTDALVDGILNTLRVKMPRPSTFMSPENEQQYNIIKHYLENSNFLNPKIHLINGRETYTLDFSGAKKYIEELKFIAEKVPFTEIQTHANNATSMGLQAINIQAISYSKQILSFGQNTKMTPFLQLYDEKTLPFTYKQYYIADSWGMGRLKAITEEQYNKLINVTDENDPLWNEVDPSGYEYGHNKDALSWKESPTPVYSTNVQDLIANSAYLSLLKAYHKVFWQFVNSDFYKTWINNSSKKRVFNVAINTTKSLAVGTHDGPGQAYKANPGELYDQPNNLKLSDDNDIKPVYEKETSNLEFLFFLHLLNLSSYLSQ